VAVPLQARTLKRASQAGDDKATSERNNAPKFSCYNFLPVANVATGLPVLLNASFIVTQNRSELKFVNEQYTEQMRGRSERERDWNLRMIEHELPFLYAYALRALCSEYAQLAGQCVRSKEELLTEFYNFFPTRAHVRGAAWQKLVDRLAIELAQKPVVLAPLLGKCMSADCGDILAAKRRCDVVFFDPNQFANADLRVWLALLMPCVNEYGPGREDVEHKPLVLCPEHVQGEVKMSHR
jgi:hypothetical protein